MPRQHECDRRGLPRFDAQGSAELPNQSFAQRRGGFLRTDFRRRSQQAQAHCPEIGHLLQFARGERHVAERNLPDADIAPAAAFRVDDLDDGVLAHEPADIE